MTIGATYPVRRANLFGLGINSTVLTYAQLRNVTLILFKLNGTEFDIIYTGEPVGRQVKFNSAAGSLKFENPVGLDEKIYTLYRF